MKKERQSYKPRIWKISHGRKSFFKSEREDYKRDRVVVVHSETGKDQGKNFMSKMRHGDFFYLCHASQVQLFGRIKSDAAPFRSKGAAWLQRSYEVIWPCKNSDAKYDGRMKWWTPNCRTTCILVPQGELPQFETVLLKPFFRKTLDQVPARKRRSDNRPPDTDDGLGRITPDTRIARPTRNYQLDFEIHTREKVTEGKRTEARLVSRYRSWLARQGRKLPTFKCDKLQCDGFEEGPRNLIEAKSTSKREHIRMAVGQLLDYAYQARKKFGRLNKAILVRKKPHEDVEEWLRDLEISLIWPDKEAFRDNAKGRFI